MHYTILELCQKVFQFKLRGFHTANLTHSNLGNINNICSFDRLRLLLLEGAFSFVETVCCKTDNLFVIP